MAKEDNEQFFLHCPSCNELRQDLLGQLSQILNKDALNLNPKELSSNVARKPILSVIDDRMIIGATIHLLRIPNVLNKEAICKMV